MAVSRFIRRNRDGESGDPFHWRTLLKDAILLIVGFALGVMGNWVFVCITQDTRIQYVACSDGHVVAYNQQGQILWSGTQPAAINDVALWTSPDSTEQIVVVVTEAREWSSKQVNTEYSGAVIAYNQDGTTRWRQALRSQCPYNTSQYEFTSFRGKKVVIAACRGVPSIVVLFGHYLRFPSAIAQYRLFDGDTLGTYWNPGQPGTLALVRDSATGKDYVLWANVPNNDLPSKSPAFVGQPPAEPDQYALMCMLFDPDSIHGDAPNRVLGRDTCVNHTGKGSELWLLMARWGQNSAEMSPGVMARYNAQTHRTKLEFESPNLPDTVDLLEPWDSPLHRVFRRRVTLTREQWLRAKESKLSQASTLRRRPVR